MERNRSLQTLEELDEVINWNGIDKTLMKHYHIGISNEGADTYPPLMLFKSLLLEQWFRPS